MNGRRMIMLRSRLFVQPVTSLEEQDRNAIFDK
jgi:hypothetical protein